MKHFILPIIFFTFLIQSCSSDPLDVDVSDIVVELEIVRLENEMFEVKSVEEMKQANQFCIDKGGELYEFYVGDMLLSGSVYDDSIANYLWYFVQDTIMRTVYHDIVLVFDDFSIQEERFMDMFKHLKYHIPTAPLPNQILTYNSAFNYGVVSTDNRIGIGLEMYLGEYNQTIEKLGFPQFIKAKMDAEYLPIDVAHSWIITHILGEEPGDNFLDRMIYYGKLRYLIDAMMPDIEDHLKIRYTMEEYDFALASEYDVWLYIMDMDWVYSTDITVLLRFFEEAPTTFGIEGSPGRLGQFMGWQIVRQYMEMNPEISVEELIKEENSGKILKYYKPEEE